MVEQSVQIPADGTMLEGVLTIPPDAPSVVLFAHGSGSSRLSPRNTFVAGELNKAGIGTLLFDLLSRREDRVYENRFDIELLAGRLQTATSWLREQPAAGNLATGYFGASTGTAAALIATADLGPEIIKAVVSRGGRPDLAGPALARVHAPVLLIVGGNDEPVIGLNREAYSLIPGRKELKIVPGATHLFEESGTLEEVANLAVTWFSRYLGAGIQGVRKRAS